METLTKPQVLHLGGGMAVGARRDLDDKYRELRRPRKVRLLCNGDGHYRGKRISVVPHRYVSFNDLLTDFTNQLNGVQLPYGVRRVYTPVGGTRVKDIDQLQDGQAYVCAGFEPFKAIKYVDEDSAANNARLREQELLAGGGHSLMVDTRALYSFPLRQSLPSKYVGYHAGRDLDLGQWRTARVDIHGLKRPRIVTIMRPGHRPIPTIRILLNRNSLQSYEQLIKDISDAFGAKFKDNCIQKMYSLKGREVQGMSELFRDDVFIGVGNEPLSLEGVESILDEIYPDNAYYISTLMRYWDKDKTKNWHHGRGGKGGAAAAKTKDRKKLGHEDGHMDSGLGSEDGGNRATEHPGDDEVKDDVTAKDNNSSGSVSKPSDGHGGGERTGSTDDKAKQRLRKRLRKQLVGNENLPPMPEEPHKAGAEKPAVGKQQRHAKRDASPAELRVESNATRRQSVDAESVAAASAAAQPAGDDSGKKDAAESNVNVSSEAPPVPVPATVADVPVSEEKDVTNETSTAAAAKVETQGVEPDAKPAVEQPTTTAQPEEPKQQQPQVPATEEHVTTTARRQSKDDNAVNVKADQQQQHDTARRKSVDDAAKAVKKRRASKDKPVIVQKSKLERQVSNAKHVLEKYELGRILGDGNFAIVKQCKVAALGQEFAMKIVDKSKLKGKEFMIENEIAIMKLCDHPNIVKLFEEFETKDEIYLVMELVKGGDLFDAITKSTKFGEGQAARLSADICQALFYLHSRAVVHRDLKPENILVYVARDGSLTAKLADFGLAMEVKEPIFTVCGTPTYVAPEILTEKGYGLEVDLWALGVITYILLCGFPPFRSAERRQSELFQFIKSGDYEFLSPYWDRISRSAKDLIEHLLIVDRHRRYTSIDVLCHPWIMTHGEVRPPLDNLEERCRTLRKQLETDSKANLESFRKLRNG